MARADSSARRVDEQDQTSTKEKPRTKDAKESVIPNPNPDGIGEVQIELKQPDGSKDRATLVAVDATNGNETIAKKSKKGSIELETGTPAEIDRQVKTENKTNVTIKELNDAFDSSLQTFADATGREIPAISKAERNKMIKKAASADNPSIALFDLLKKHPALSEKPEPKEQKETGPQFVEITPDPIYSQGPEAIEARVQELQGELVASQNKKPEHTDQIHAELQRLNTVLPIVREVDRLNTAEVMADMLQATIDELNEKDALEAKKINRKIGTRGKQILGTSGRIQALTQTLEKEERELVALSDLFEEGKTLNAAKSQIDRIKQERDKLQARLKNLETDAAQLKAQSAALEKSGLSYDTLLPGTDSKLYDELVAQQENDPDETKKALEALLKNDKTAKKVKETILLFQKDLKEETVNRTERPDTEPDEIQPEVAKDETETFSTSEEAYQAYLVRDKELWDAFPQFGLAGQEFDVAQSEYKKAEKANASADELRARKARMDAAKENLHRITDEARTIWKSDEKISRLVKMTKELRQKEADAIKPNETSAENKETPVDTDASVDLFIEEEQDAFHEIMDRLKTEKDPVRMQKVLDQLKERITKLENDPESEILIEDEVIASVRVSGGLKPEQKKRAMDALQALTIEGQALLQEMNRETIAPIQTPETIVPEKGHDFSREGADELLIDAWDSYPNDEAAKDSLIIFGFPEDIVRNAKNLGTLWRIYNNPPSYLNKERIYGAMNQFMAEASIRTENDKRDARKKTPKIVTEAKPVQPVPEVITAEPLPELPAESIRPLGGYEKIDTIGEPDFKRDAFDAEDLAFIDRAEAQQARNAEEAANTPPEIPKEFAAEKSNVFGIKFELTQDANGTFILELPQASRIIDLGHNEYLARQAMDFAKQYVKDDPTDLGKPEFIRTILDEAGKQLQTLEKQNESYAKLVGEDTMSLETVRIAFEKLSPKERGEQELPATWNEIIQPKKPSFFKRLFGNPEKDQKELFTKIKKVVRPENI